MYRYNSFFVFLNTRFQIICTLKMSQLGCKDIGYGPLLLTFIEQRECVTIILARVKKAKQYQIHRSLICSVNVHNWMDVFPMGKFVLLKLFYQTGVCKSNDSESVSMLCYELVLHHKWADAVFHGRCAVFWGR